MRKKIKLIRRWLQIVTKKNVTADDLVDWWLILFHGTTHKEQEQYYTMDETKEFLDRFEVEEWKFNLWHRWMMFALRKKQSAFFIERRFPFIGIYIPNKEFIKRGAWGVVLNCSPKTKQHGDNRKSNNTW